MSARFLLEFEATGDQEVVNAINQVSEAGKQAATDLEGLQSIEDPFTAITSGAEGAVTPLENIGGATEDLSGIFTAAGTQSEEFGGALTSMNDSAMAVEGGLTDANTAVGDFGTAATGAGTSATDAMGGIGQMSGAVVALGGTIGTAVSTIFRMQDAQLQLDKANLKATRSTESARKAGVAFDTLLKTAKTNTDGIAEARDKLSEAQDKLNKLQESGVTSGSDYEAAQAAVAEATANLRSEFAAGGGDVAKFDSALNKVKITGEAQEIATKNLEKATRNFGQTAVDTGFSIAGLVGTGIQAVSSLGKMKEGALTAATAFKGIGTAISGIGLGTIGVAFGAAGAAVAVFMGAVIALNKAPYDAIVGQLDKIGKKVGEVFPQAKDMLTSLGDAMGSSLDFLAGYSKGLIKQLTGIELQADVTKKSFSELVQIFLKDGTTGYTQINRAIAGYVDAAREQGLTDKEIIDLAKKHNDEKKKSVTATNELTAATVEYGNAADNNLVVTEQIASTIAALPGAIGNTVNDVELFTAAFEKQTGVINNHRNVLATNEGVMIRSGGSYVQLAGNVEDLGTGVSRVNGTLVNNADILNKSGLSAKRNANSVRTMEAAWQDVEVGISEAESALFTERNALEKGIDAKIEMAHVNNLLTGSELDFENALADVAVALSKSNRELATAKKVRADAKAQADMLATALNNEVISLINAEAALKANIAATRQSEIQSLRLSNAKLEGTKAAMEFIAALDEEKASQEANIAVLRQSVDAMGQFGDTSLLTADQLQNLAEVAAGVPSAIRALAGEIGGLAQEATKFLEFAGEEDELFGNWKIADTVPQEIKAMMSKADLNFIEGRAQLERSLESLGPLVGVKFARAIQQGGEGGLAQLRKFGPEAADIIRQSGAEMDPAIQELVSAFDALGTVTGTTVVDAMARVVTAMDNVEDPAAGLAANLTKMANEGAISSQQLLDLAQAGVITSDALAQTALGVDGLAEATAGSAEGLNSLFGAMESVAGQGKTLVLELDKLNKVSIEGVGNFVQVGDQLLPIGPAAQGAATGLGAMTNAINPLNSAIQLAGTTIQQFSDYVVKAFTQDIPNAVNNAQNIRNPLEGMITVAIASVDQLVASVNEKISGIKPTVTTNPLTGMITAAMASASQLVSSVNEKIGTIGKGIMPKIQLDISAATQQIAKLKQQIGGVKAAPIVINVSFKIIGKPPVPKEIKGFISYAYRITNKIPNPPEIKRFISYAYRITNKIPNPPEIKRWISYKYRVVGSKPNPQNINRTITYRYRTVGTRPAQTGMHETLGEDTMIAAHKGERVDISPNAGGKENVVTGGFGGGGGGGKIIEIISITQLDGKVLTRNVKRHLMEDVGGVA